MKTKYLFPHRCQALGWTLFIPGLIMGILYLAFDFQLAWLEWRVPALATDSLFGDSSWFQITENNMFDEITAILVILGGLLIAFSRSKSEDEYMNHIRWESLVWATYVNYFILLLAIVLLYDLIFFWVLVFNMFTLLFFFIARFYWALHRVKKESEV